MKILIDVNLSFRWADMLMHEGIEAVYWSTLGADNAPDTEIMAYALANGYTVLTKDLDFGDILAATHGIQPSIVQIRAVDAQPQSLIKRVVDAVTRLTAELEQGALVTIDMKKTRIHILPFTSRPFPASNSPIP